MAFRWKKMDFISEIDQHFAHWKDSMPLSPSQQREIAQYKRIDLLRDQVQEKPFFSIEENSNKAGELF